MMETDPLSVFAALYSGAIDKSNLESILPSSKKMEEEELKANE